MKNNITEEEIKDTIKYLFKENIHSELDDILYITDNKDYLSFKIGNFTTGLEGIKNIYKSGVGLGVTDISYNGVILNEIDRKIILNKIFK